MNTLVPLAWILATVWFVYEGKSIAWIFFIMAVVFSFIGMMQSFNGPTNPTTNLFLGETDES